MRDTLLFKFICGMAFGLLLVLVLVIARTLDLGAAAITDSPVAMPAIDGQPIAARLSQAIRFQTISSQLEQPQTQAQFREFIEWLADTYPEVHRALPPQKLGREAGQAFTLLYTWPGRQADLPPVMLSAHYDVVPVQPGTEDDWQHPAYGGEIADGYIWGRGALDDKSAAIALMEAATSLLAEGFQPERTVYISLTSDEEIGSYGGAGAVVDLLQSQGIQLAWTLDEGSFLLDGFLPGLSHPLASINVAEKGYLTVELRAQGQGGHSSMPPAQTAVDVLAKALARLDDAPLPGGLSGISRGLFDAAAPYLPFKQRVAFANQWLFVGLIEDELKRNPVTAAMLHTTTAPTMLSASVKENILPTTAVATVNFRIHPRDTIASILSHLNKVIDDERVTVVVGRKDPASRVSSDQSEGFRLLVGTVRDLYGPVVVAPGLTIGGTDSRRYQAIANDNYRFNPMRVTRADAQGFHGTDERISIDNMVMATAFYERVIKGIGIERTTPPR